MKHCPSSVRWVAVSACLALAACRSAPRATEAIDVQLAQYASSAQAAFSRQQYARAGRFFHLALQRARAIDDSREIGKQAYNLAAALHLQGRSEEALSYLAEAQQALEENRLDSAPVWLLRARALRAVGRLSEARSAASRVVSMNTPADVQAQAWLVYGHVSLDQGETGEAEKALARARALASADAALQAGIAGLAARLNARAGDQARAGLLFDEEARALQRAGRFRDMADALRRAGEAYAAAGDIRAAGDRLYRAARSFYGQGDRQKALEAIEQMLALAPPGQEMPWAAPTASLFEEIRRRPMVETPAQGDE